MIPVVSGFMYSGTVNGLTLKKNGCYVLEEIFRDEFLVCVLPQGNPSSMLFVVSRVVLSQTARVWRHAIQTLDYDQRKCQSLIKIENARSIQSGLVK